MLKKLSDGTAWSRISRSVPVRILLAILLTTVAYHSSRLAISDLSRQELESMMEQFHKTGGSDVSELQAAARDLQDYPFTGAFSAVRGDAYSLIRYNRSQDNQNTDVSLDTDSAVEEYRQALRMRPGDGYLWARYGLYLSSLDPGENRDSALQAMDRAMELSPRDYNTMRVVGNMGVRYWHELDCDRRTRLLTILDRAALVDDSLLSRWITQLGQQPMAKYLDSTYKRYGFNPRWARASVAACSGGAGG